jgi:hypothetical protein
MSRLQRDALARRQQQLLIRSAELRVMLAQQAQVLQAPLAVADQVRAGVRWLRQHPQWPLGAALVLALRRPRRALGWASRLWWGWGLYQRLQQWLNKLPPQRR